ncbi:poly-gamma-glutamate hydrolase family protein, partial [Staphylococcus epidermidis]|uniref:poly-gamma-glutamate hydrolase family protein n=1 Tax=Staphylococcus epidermidis TaxID=1282 RepID=UPI0037DA6ADF
MSHSITKQLPKKHFTLKQTPNKIHPNSSHNIPNKNQSNSPLQLQLTTPFPKHFFKHYKLHPHT